MTAAIQSEGPKKTVVPGTPTAEEAPITTPTKMIQSLISLSFDRAKTWAAAHLALEALIYVSGIAAVFIPAVPIEYPAIAVGLLLATTWLDEHAKNLKAVGEALLREHEYSQGFGITPSRELLADRSAKAGKRLRQELEARLLEGLTFSSEAPIGAKRSLENLHQSSWFSQQNAGWWSEKLFAAFAVTCAFALLVMLVLFESTATAKHGHEVAKCFSSTLAFLITVGTLKSSLEFRTFGREAGRIQTEAGRLLDQGSIDPLRVQRLLSEYQLIRASAPMIPTFVWSWRQAKLNTIWATLQK